MRDLSGFHQTLVEIKESALLIASRNGIRQLVDGKLKSYSVPPSVFTAERLLLGNDGDYGLEPKALYTCMRGRPTGYLPDT
jgi:hypothetical protein